MVTSIAIAGKGGIGKSTIAGLIVLDLIKKKQTPVLALDADPDSNLASLLGFPNEASVADLREEIKEEMKNFPAGMSKAQYVEAGLHQAILEGEGFDLVTMGRGEGAGCYCYLNSLIKKFCDDLLPSYKSVVMDNEAGLEHLSRRTSTHVDALITVVTDNPLSFACAEKVAEITRSIKNKFFNLYIVSNLVKPHRLEKVEARIAELPMKYLGTVPYDENLEELIFEGLSLADLTESPVLDAIDTIVNTIGGNDGSA